MGFSGVGLYVKNSREAVELYLRVFGLELGYHVLNEDGSYFHSELNLNGEEQFSVVEAEQTQAEETIVQLAFTFETSEALLAALGQLSQGGKVLMEVCKLPWSPCAAEVCDRFGVRWYLTVPQHRPPDNFEPSDCK